MLTALYAFGGYEGASTLAEETVDPHKNAPWGIVYTVVVSFVVGLITMISMLYATQGEIERFVDGEDSKTRTLFLLVFNGNESMATAFSLIVAVMIFSSGFSGVTVFSRIAYSMSRDGALPYSDYLKVVDKDTQVPLRVIFVVFMCCSLLNMLPLVST